MEQGANVIAARSIPVGTMIRRRKGARLSTVTVRHDANGRLAVNDQRDALGYEYRVDGATRPVS